MEALLAYLNALSPPKQVEFARRCGTSVGYIRKVISAEKRFGESLAIAFERESRGAIKCEEVRPDVDWAYIRGTKKRRA